MIQPQRILEVLNAYPGETFIREHARAIIEDGRIDLGWAFWQVGRPGKRPPPLEGLYRCEGLFNVNRSSSLRKAFVRLKYFNRRDSYRREVLQTIASFKPDIVHFHFASLAVQHYQAVIAAKVPFTFSVRGSDLLVTPKSDPGFVDRLRDAVLKASGIHTVSNHLRDELFGYFGENDKTAVIRTAVSRGWSQVQRDVKPLTFVAVGRLHWVKGYGDLLLAFRRLVEGGLDLHLKIVGDGDQRDMLEYMTRDLDLSSRVTFTGKLSSEEIKTILAQSDALVMSSLSEGFPNVAAEAMLARVPVIATTASMLHEILEPGRCFISAETGDPVSLAGAVLSFLALKGSERTEMLDRAYELALEHCSPESHAAGFYAFWTKALTR